MEPLKPEEKDRILQDRPDSSWEEIEEYERLLGQRFLRDPSAIVFESAAPADSIRDSRLRELFSKLFG
jgi:hypothetical protein